MNSIISYSPSEEIELSDYLREWNIIAGKHTNSFAEQKLLDHPYILEKNQDGADIKLIIANNEGRTWYDQLIYTEISHLYNFGMIRSGDVVFDCGANQGVNSLVYSHAVGPSGSVHAFDPFPLNTDIFNFNMRMNGVKNVRHHQVGLSDKSEDVVVSALQQSAAADAGAHTAADAVTIKLESLDKYADLQPNLLKLDIEGSEINALIGAQKILDTVPAIYVELHTAVRDNFGQDMMDIFEVINMKKYECYIGHPQKGMIRYNKDFTIDFHCQIYFIPKTRPFIRRTF